MNGMNGFRYPTELLLPGHKGTPEVVSVVGGGYSVTHVNTAKLPGFVIAVNDAALHLPRVDAVVSMDRKWTEYRWSHLLKLNKITWIRDSALKNVWHHGGDQWDRLFVFSGNNKKDVFSQHLGALNGSNSGACAANLVFHMRPKMAWFFGFDMGRGPKGEPYWYEPYPWSPKGATKEGHYRTWAAQLEGMMAQLEGVGIKHVVVSDRRWSKSVTRLTTEEFRVASS